VRRFSGNALEIVKVFVAPKELDLLQVHLDDLAEANQQIQNDLAHQLVLPSHVDLLDRAVIVRRPWVQWTLANLMHDQLGTARMDGRELESWERRWLAHQLKVAVERLHAAGLFHGSLHPGNILVDGALRLHLADLAPYKPYAFPADDPTSFLYFYQSATQLAYIDPQRWGAAAGSVADRQQADLFAVAVILRELSVEEPVSFTTPVTSVILPLLKQATDNGLEQLEARMEDLELLAGDDEDVSRILVRFLIQHTSHLQDESASLKTLAQVRTLMRGTDLCGKFYLEALAKVSSSVAVARACKELLDLPQTAKCAQESSWLRPGQILRNMSRLVVSRDQLAEMQQLIPALLVYPDDRVRLAALKLVHGLANKMPDEIDRIALLPPLVVSALGIENCPFDLAHIPPESLLYLVKSPLSKDLLDLVSRNANQIQQLLQAVAPKDAAKIRLIEPLLARCVEGIIFCPQLTRKDLHVNPVALSEGSSHDSFSPLLSPVDDSDDVEICQVPVTIEPTAYRHFQQRRLPFRFDAYNQAAFCGDYFLLVGLGSVEIWRCLDFRLNIIPTPWLTVEYSGIIQCALSLLYLYAWNNGIVTVFELQRKTKLFELPMETEPAVLCPFKVSSLLVALDRSLVLYEGQKTIWASESQPLYHGAIEDLIASDDGLYAISATSNGFLSLWDLRYGLCLRSWKLPLKVGKIYGISLVKEDDSDVCVSPPKLWIASELDGKARVLHVDFAQASITLSTEPALADQPLLSDANCALEDTYALPSHSMAHPTGATWILLTTPKGNLQFCFLRHQSLELTDIRTGFPVKPLRKLHVLKPTSIESSRNLSLLMLARDGTATILECFK